MCLLLFICWGLYWNLVNETQKSVQNYLTKIGGQSTISSPMYIGGLPPISCLAPMVGGKLATYTSGQISSALQKAYGGIGRPELFKSIKHLIK